MRSQPVRWPPLAAPGVSRTRSPDARLAAACVCWATAGAARLLPGQVVRGRLGPSLRMARRSVLPKDASTRPTWRASSVHIGHPGCTVPRVAGISAAEDLGTSTSWCPGSAATGGSLQAVAGQCRREHLGGLCTLERSPGVGAVPRQRLVGPTDQHPHFVELGDREFTILSDSTQVTAQEFRKLVECRRRPGHLVPASGCGLHTATFDGTGRIADHASLSRLRSPVPGPSSSPFPRAPVTPRGSTTPCWSGTAETLRPARSLGNPTR